MTKLEDFQNKKQLLLLFIELSLEIGIIPNKAIKKLKKIETYLLKNKEF